MSSEYKWMPHNNATLPASVIVELQQHGKLAAIQLLRELEPGLGLVAAIARLDAYQLALSSALPTDIIEMLRSGERLRAVHELAVQQALPLSEAAHQIDAVLRVDLQLRESYLAGCGLGGVVRVSFQDGLAFPSGQVAPSSHRCVVYCRMPANWLANGQMSGSALEAIYEMLYGSDWRNGNSDGSRYVVRDARCELLDTASKETRPWLQAANDSAEHFWFARANPDGTVAQIERALF